LAQRCRIKILSYYRSLGLVGDTYAFIAAITLGYKAYLSDDIKKAFQASGTAHLLAVSGLHTGIIYLILSLLLSPLGRRGIGFRIRQWTIILMLCGYAFLAGLSASVVRAVIMLSLYCMGRLRQESSFTVNTLAAAAFLILIFQPNSFYDISFQMSFGAVFSILWFQPRIAALVKTKKKITKYLWNLMTLSLSAQLGLFPLLLYHFGTFPTWFFITNILVVPLLGGIIYSMIPLLLTGLLPITLFNFLEWLPQILQSLVQLLTNLMLTLFSSSNHYPSLNSPTYRFHCLLLSCC
jgi:competence protein ComEC